MIREQDLLDAIAECQGERNPDAKTCIKLAAYYTILNNIGVVDDVPTYSTAGASEQVRYQSGSEFFAVISKRNIDDVLMIMDELMDTIQVLMPKLYYATMDKLRG